MKVNIVSGGSLAVAALALAMAGAATTAATNKAAAKEMVHCMGINSCKGQSACKSANNDCKGLNSCKGKGWLPAKSKAACEKKGGTVTSM
jgi:hypothetical protein